MKRMTAALGLLLTVFAVPALAGDSFTLKASGAQTGAAQGSLVEAGAYRVLHIAVNVTAGSGTVNPFRIWLEGSPNNGTDWYEIPCYGVLKAGATAPGAANSTLQRDIVNEAAVVTSQKYVATCELYFTQVRAAWNIAGSTPSETFSVVALGK